MRFLGLVVAMIGAAVVYFLGYKGMTVDQARTRLATLLNLPGLNPPAPTTTSIDGSPPVPIVTPGGKSTPGGRPFNPKGNLGAL